MKILDIINLSNSGTRLTRDDWLFLNVDAPAIIRPLGKPYAVDNRGGLFKLEKIYKNSSGIKISLKSAHI
mgnify:CR=1 FL=1